MNQLVKFYTVETGQRFRYNSMTLTKTNGSSIDSAIQYNSKTDDDQYGNCIFQFVADHKLVQLLEIA